VNDSYHTKKVTYFGIPFSSLIQFVNHWIRYVAKQYLLRTQQDASHKESNTFWNKIQYIAYKNHQENVHMCWSILSVYHSQSTENRVYT